MERVMGGPKKATAKTVGIDKAKSVATATDSAVVYRRLALALPGAVEASHMGAPDFRVDGRIFATLAYGSKGLGTLKISVEQQADFVVEAPQWFQEMVLS